MQTIDDLIAILKRNEEISAKFHTIEMKILSILDFTGLFEVLLSEIREKFQVPYVWLTLIDSDNIPDIHRFLKTSDVLDTNLNVISSENFFALVSKSTRPLMVNDDLKPFFRLLPFQKKLLIKSMAICPITLDGHIIGSLNQADFSGERFSPDVDTSLLEQLALKVSLCLSNVIAHEKLKYLAYHDPLTGLLNRRIMESILNREFLRAQRYQYPLSLVFLDVDDFKIINDQYGHDMGDKLLIYFSRELERLVRNSDVIARFAGDEFVIILPETPAVKANNFMERVKLHLLQTPLTSGGVRIPISISFGVASNENDSIDNSEALLKLSDIKLYEMKTSRKVKQIDTSNFKK